MELGKTCNFTIKAKKNPVIWELKKKNQILKNKINIITYIFKELLHVMYRI